jgi:nicotinamidase/pyrazinamidase
VLQSSGSAKNMDEKVPLHKGDVLIIVDVQNCFLPGGSLGISEGDRVIVPLNDIIDKFSKKNLLVFLSRDWHPDKHISFKERGGPWPDHCVQNTKGSEFSAELRIPVEAMVFSKGTDPEHEEYSAWNARDENNRSLCSLLAEMGSRRLFIGGLATEYCVLNTVKDARRDGYEIYVLSDAIEAVNANPGDSERAIREMIAAGAKMISTRNVGL